jgi:hypothetical protein
MSKRSIGIAIIIFGGLIYAAALVMGIVGFPRPGWGHYKILLAIIGAVVAAAGMLLLERSLKNENDPSRKNNRLFLYGCILNLVLSILPRLPFMDHISSWWRSSHTLISALWFQKEGINLFHYQTPVYGPPWQVPLEFPLYQAICAVVSNLTSIDLTLSARLTSLAIFYLSALFLMLLCIEFIDSRPLCLIILTVYLWLPFNIRYSTEILPDYFSVVLALGYLYWIYKWLKTPRNIPFFVLAVLFGALGAMVKITTMPIVVIPAVLMALNAMREWGMTIGDLSSPQKLWVQIKKHKWPLLLLAGIAVLPIVAEIQWVKLEDSIKQANIYTAWLTSANSSDWWYGTWPQKLSYAEWMGKFTNLKDYFLFGPIMLFPIVGIMCLYKLPLKSRFVFGSAITATLLTIFIFFNLYFHEYYYIAVAALISITIGFGIYCLYTFILRKNIWWNVFAGVLFLFILIGGVEKFNFILNTMKEEVDFTDDVIIPLAAKAAALTPEGEYVIAFQDEWWPDFFLFVQRKGLIITPREQTKFTCESIANVPYTTLVVVNQPVDTPEKMGLLGCFKSVEMIEPGLYKVAP